MGRQEHSIFHKHTKEKKQKEHRKMKVKEIVQQQSELIIDTHTAYKAIVLLQLEKLPTILLF
jgi:adenylate kinase